MKDFNNIKPEAHTDNVFKLLDKDWMLITAGTLSFFSEECRKLYSDDLIAENFVVPEIASKHYPKNDFHRFYMGEIENSFVRE